MRQLSADAILLDVVDLHEKDRIVQFLTAELGAKRGVARGARTKFSRFGGRLQPLARVQIEWFERDDRELVRIRDVSLVRAATRTTGELEHLLVGTYIADHAGLFAPENEANPKLFRLLDACLRALEGDSSPSLVARYFEVWALRLAGVFPSIVVCGSCARELENDEQAWLVEDQLRCRDCCRTERFEREETRGPMPAGSDNQVRVSDEARGLLAAMLVGGPETVMFDAARTGALVEIERLTAAIRRQFLGDELKSYQVLKRTLAGVRGRAT